MRSLHCQLIMPALTLAINLSFFLLLKLNQSNKKSFTKGGKHLPQLWDGFIWITPGYGNLGLKSPLCSVQFCSVQSLSRVRLFVTPWIAARQASLSITNSWSLFKLKLILTSIESEMPSSHLILCRPLLLLHPIPPSIRVFSNESILSWGGQSTGVSALASFLPKKSQGWSPSEWTGWR